MFSFLFHLLNIELNILWNCYKQSTIFFSIFLNWLRTAAVSKNFSDQF